MCVLEFWDRDAKILERKYVDYVNYQKDPHDFRFSAEALKHIIESSGFIRRDGTNLHKKMMSFLTTDS